MLGIYIMKNQTKFLFMTALFVLHNEKCLLHSEKLDQITAFVNVTTAYGKEDQILLLCFGNFVTKLRLSYIKMTSYCVAGAFFSKQKVLCFGDGCKLGNKTLEKVTFFTHKMSN